MLNSHKWRNYFKRLSNKEETKTIPLPGVQGKRRYLSRSPIRGGDSLSGALVS